MMRTPSLRELRRNLPENLMILPTAQPRQVQQNCTRAARQARVELEKTQAHKFPYKPRWQRERERKEAERAEEASATAHIRRTPEMIIALSVFGMMEEGQRRAALAVAKLAEIAGHPNARDAVLMMEQVANLTDVAQ